MDGFLGEVKLFAGNFAPNGWVFCQGQTLNINVNLALWSILGTIYGGDGIRTFMLPDYQGRAPVGFGSGASLTAYTLGQLAGAPTNTLTLAQVAHTHTVTGSISSMASSHAADQQSPVGNYFASGDGSKKFDAQHDGVTMQYNITLDNTGNSDPVTNMMPYQAINYIICISGGIYPSH
ncbi:MAG: phage tail protein [Niastella sp.]|uniref:phage tail protein n=1 Tax=Niastella sp. TaxID=1869183 RepID=UPI00389A214D